ncbi:MAG: hypothetical protein LBN33_07075, partial [Desulfovibrio sp.]|nr:hypothetical protein [Desulfovibrio sp.]
MMSNDPETPSSTIAKICNDMEAFNRAITPVNKNVVEQIKRIVEPFNFTQLELLSRSVSSLNSAISSSSLLHSLDGIVAAWQNFEKLNVVPLSLIENIQSSQLKIFSELPISNICLQLSASQKLLAGVDFNFFKTVFPRELSLIPEVESAIASTVTAYGNLAEAFQENPGGVRLPNVILPGATREIYTASFALDSLYPREALDEEYLEEEIHLTAQTETADCLALLQQVDPDLARPYVGARDALNSNNTDRTRHILISLRELWTHLLRRLAPDNLVTAWIPVNANPKTLLHDGKPTRQARVLYVCRDLNSAPLAEFLTQDTRSLVKLIEIFNHIHDLNMTLTDKQLRAII